MYDQERPRIYKKILTTSHSPLQMWSNLLLGSFMCEMNQHWEVNHLINKGTYWDWKNQRLIDKVIVNVAQVKKNNDYTQILVQFNNDTTACLDQIIPRILCLCLWSYQITTKFTALLGNLLCYVKYGIKITNGKAQEIYSHSTFYYFHILLEFKQQHY